MSYDLAWSANGQYIEVCRHVLHAYWSLAIAAALVTVLPIPGIDWFR
jgi:hypothetical protein